MTQDVNNIETSIEILICLSVGHQCEIGIYPFELHDGKLTSKSHVFNYADGVAVAALIKEGFAEHDAANLVRHHLVHATPQSACMPVDVCLTKDVIGKWTVGYFRLADGAVWAVHADSDVNTYSSVDYEGEYLVVPTRGNQIADESAIERVQHMLTQCDLFGRPLVSAA